MVYEWKKASCIKANPQTAGKICEDLDRTVGLTAKNLLDVSRPEGAALHAEFEWNDATAAEKYREDQAAHMIRSLCVRLEDTRGEPVRAFVKVTAARASPYENIVTVKSDPVKMRSLLETALDELMAFERKYQYLTELSGVFSAIHNIAS